MLCIRGSHRATDFLIQTLVLWLHALPPFLTCAHAELQARLWMAAASAMQCEMGGWGGWCARDALSRTSSALVLLSSGQPEAGSAARDCSRQKKKK